MYYPTSSSDAEYIRRHGFQSQDASLGRGVYLSRDLQKATMLPLNHPEHDKVIIQVRVNVGRAIGINYQGHPMQYLWQTHNWDTAWAPPNCGIGWNGMELFCVWDPQRIQILKFIKPTLALQQANVGGAVYYS
uniref:PARP catalytic domain-containing protein n=1 Tax=Neogobius melanostomus TaxID=47308 RepID=A0A8C6UAJ4_9GOBI